METFKKQLKHFYFKKRLIRPSFYAVFMTVLCYVIFLVKHFVTYVWEKCYINKLYLQFIAIWAGKPTYLHYVEMSR